MVYLYLRYVKRILTTRKLYNTVIIFEIKESLLYELFIIEIAVCL